VDQCRSNRFSPVKERILVIAKYTPQNGGLRFGECKVGEISKSVGVVSSQRVADAFGAVSDFLHSVPPTRLVDAAVPIKNGEKLFLAAEKLGSFFSDPSSWDSRLDCWSRNWREMPFYGRPPVLIDWWLPVDLSPSQALPSVLVPPWGGEAESHTAFAQNKETG
jgi:hypothetical protein